MKKLIFLLIGLLFITSCKPTLTITPYKVEYIKKNIPAEDIAVMETEPSEHYIAIAFVEVKKRASTAFGDVTSADLIPLLQDEASKIGGEAVINVKFERYFETSLSLKPTIPAMIATGTVIVFE